MRVDADIKDTHEWLYAQDLFKRIYANRPVYSIIGIAPTPGASWAAIDYLLQQILERCPQFYPALFQRGEYLLRIGKTGEGEGLIEEAFNNAFAILSDEEEFSEVITQRTENLGELLRYDLASKYMEKATRLFPDNASFYDYLAFYLLQLPGTDKNNVLNIQQKALEIEPDNDFFINNLGWIYLMMGNYEEADENFRQAIAYSSESTAVENLETANYMEEHHMTYFQYLLRSADLVQLENFQKCADFEEVAGMCEVYNSDKVEAFKIYHLQKNIHPAHEILDILHPLQEFLKTIHELIASGEGIFLFENSDHFFENSDSFISHFIAENEEPAPSLPDNTLDSLAAFYDFLQEIKMITTDQYTQINERIDLLKSITSIPPRPGISWEQINWGLAELIGKAPHYYPVLFKWGEYMLKIGKNSEGEKCIEKAFITAIHILSKEEDQDNEILQETFIEKTGNLKKLLRYDLAAKYMEEATRIFPEKACFYDLLASYLLQVPGHDEKRIVEIQLKALELDPGNDSYINNLGWIYLMTGNYRQAAEYFERLLEYNDENVDAVENLEITEYMENHQMTYLQFLLYVMPGEIQAFSDVGAFDDEVELFEEYNVNKLKAFEMYHLQNKILAPHEVLDILKHVENFLNIIYESLEGDDDFFFENIDLLVDKCRYFIYQFLDRSESEGEQTLNVLIHSLTAFYNFLGEMDVITLDQNQRVVEQLNILKTEFAGKLDEYYQICDDFTLSPEEKEDRVNELFDI